MNVRRGDEHLTFVSTVIRLSRIFVACGFVACGFVACGFAACVVAVGAVAGCVAATGSGSSSAVSVAAPMSLSAMKFMSSMPVLEGFVLAVVVAGAVDATFTGLVLGGRGTSLARR